MKNILLLLSLFSVAISALATEGSARRINSTYNVGQIYVGGHIGMGVPLAIGRKDSQIAFNDVAKTGFVVYADAMRLMTQNISLGADFGFRNYPYNDKKTWSNLTRYGTFEASYRALDLDVTGRLFFTTNSVRPFFGVFGGAELIMNDVDFIPSASYAESISATQYSTTNISPMFGFMAGVYMKVGKRTLLSLQGRLSFVPTLDDGIIEITNPRNQEVQTMYQNVHGNQTNLAITLGIHVGTNKNNKH